PLRRQRMALKRGAGAPADLRKAVAGGQDGQLRDLGGLFGPDHRSERRRGGMAFALGMGRKRRGGGGDSVAEQGAQVRKGGASEQDGRLGEKPGAGKPRRNLRAAIFFQENCQIP